MMLMSKIGIKGLYPHYFLYGFEGAWGMLHVTEAL